MRRFDARFVGVDQGSETLFSDFEHDGVMWTGTGPRMARWPVVFSEPFRDAPIVSVHIAMWDMDRKTNPRADLTSENVTPTGFDIVFRTWGDTRVARIRADWIAIGPVAAEDDWELY